MSAVERRAFLWGATALGTAAAAAGAVSADIAKDPQVVMGPSMPANNYNKAIRHNIFRLSPEILSIRSQYNYSSMYPQGMFVDEEEMELFVCLDGMDGDNDWQWLQVHDWETGAFKGIFSAGGPLSEGLAVYQHNGSRVLVIKNGSGSVAEYDITTLPSNGTRLSPLATHPVGLQSQIAHWGEQTFIASNANPIGPSSTLQRTVIKRYDKDFHLTGFVRAPRQFSGHTDAYEQANFPKRQALAAGPGFFATGDGGLFVDQGAVSPTLALGSAVFDTNGAILAQNHTDPQKTIDLLRAHGYADTNRVENEGAWISRSGKIYTLWVTVAANAAAMENGGMLIVEEYSTSEDSIDFSSAAFDIFLADQGDTVFPQRLEDSASGLPVNPITGDELANLTDIANYMRDNMVREFKFYTGSFSILDIFGSPLESYRWVTVTNSNHFTYWVEIVGNRGSRRLYLSRSGQSFTQADVSWRIASMDSADVHVLFLCGSGSPQGVVSAPPGSLYTDTNGGAGSTLYVKESGTASTGWAAK